MPGRSLLLDHYSPSPTSLIYLLESCTSFKQALQVHAQIILKGLHHSSIFYTNRLVSFFALSDSAPALHHSRLVFSCISRPNLFSWNTMIRGYSRSPDSPQEALLLYRSMISRGFVSPNSFTFPFLINSCARLSTAQSGMQIHSHVIRYGLVSNIVVTNSLVHFYCSFGDLGLARKMFDESSEPDLVSCNTLMNGYTRGGRPVDALRLVGEMQVLGLKPDDFTVVALLSACSVLNDIESAKQIHALMYKNTSDFDSRIHLKNALVDIYAKCGLMETADKVFRTTGVSDNTFAWSSMVCGYAKSGEIEVAWRLFNEMPERDSVSWTAMISSYAQAGRYSEALELFEQMEKAGSVPDEVTMVSVLSACAQLGALDYGRRIHRYIENRSFEGNFILCTAIVDMYAKCGSIETALDIFIGFPEKSKTVALFNAMISGLAQHALGKKAMAVFNELLCAGLRPDEITFVVLLCAFSHSGLIEEGKKLLHSMEKDYGIKPRIEHYGCMVDLLGRGGFLEEALDLIEKMPIDVNDCVIWASLLSACRIHGNMKMSEIVSKRLQRMDPNNGGHYVLMSNIFADANRWEDATRVRKQMETKGIQKPPGFSYIELNGHIYQFLSGDMSSPQRNEIDLMLQEMTKRLRLAGYVPNTAQVTFDIDEEERENAVSCHSEKLALAFGLINSGPDVTIRIMKNLRICGNCHSSFKLLSKIFCREIIMRDRFRFHHFKSGFCSCKDYW